MKLNKLMIVSLILLAVLTFGAVSATDNLTADGTSDSVELGVSEADILVDEDGGDEIEDTRWDLYYDIDVPPSVRAGPVNFEEGDDEFEGYVNLDGDTNGNYSVWIDGEKWFGGDNVPGIEIGFHLNDYPNLTDYGNHTFEFRYSGDETYLPFNVTREFEYYYYRVIAPDEVIVGGDSSPHIICELAVDATGDILVLIDDEEVLNSSVYDARHDEETGDFIFGIWIPLDSLSLEEHTYNVTYSNGNYDDFSVTGTFDMDYNFLIENWKLENDEPFYYGETIDFDITVPYDATENVTLILNGKRYVIEMDGISATYEASDYEFGENNFTFVYEDSKYPEKSLTYIIDVKGKIFGFDAEGAEYTIGYGSSEDSSIYLTLPMDAEGKLALYHVEFDEYGDYELGDMVKNATFENGTASISLSDLDLGRYTFLARYDGDDYDVEDEFEYFTVVPRIQYPTGIYNESDEEYYVIATSPEDGEGNLTVSIYSSIEEFEDYYEMGDQLYEIYNGNASGVKTIAIPDLRVGLYYLYVIYDIGESCFYERHMFRVDNNDPNWEIDFTFPDKLVKSYWDENCVWYKPNNIPEHANGKLIVYVDGVREASANLKYDECEFDLYYGSMDYGNHTWEMRYVDDTYYNPTSINGTFEVTWITIPEIIPQDYSFSHDLIYSNGEVTLYLEGEEYDTQTIDENCVSFALHDLELYKTYDYMFVYSNDDGDSLTASGSFYASYLFEAYFADESTYSIWSDLYDFFISLPEDAYGNVTVIVGNKTYDCDVEAGNAVVKLTDLDPNTSYDVIVQYSGYGVYVPNNITVDIYIDDYGIIDEYSNDTFTGLSLTLPADAEGNLTVEINGEIYKSVPLEDGYAIVRIDDLLGYLNLYSYYTGNDYWVPVHSNTVSFSPEMNITDNIDYGDDCIVEIELPNATGLLEIHVDGDLYETYSVFDGRIEAYISDLDEGDHILNFYYLGDEFYPLFKSYYEIDEGVEDSEPIDFWVHVNEYERYEVEGVEFCDGNAMDNGVIVKIPKASVDGLDEVFNARLELWNLEFEKDLNLSEIDSDDEFYLIKIADIIDDASEIDERDGCFRLEFYEDGEYTCFAEDDVVIYNSPYFSPESSILYNNPVVTLREIPEGADELTISVFKEGSLIANNTFNIAELSPVSDDWEDYDGNPVYEFTDSQLGITEAGEYNITVDFLKDSASVKAYSQMVDVSLVNIIVCTCEEEDDEGNIIPRPFQFVDEDIFVIKVPENLTGYYVNIYKDDVQLGGDIDISDLMYNDGWGWQAQARAVKLNDLNITLSGDYSIRLEFYSENGTLLASETNDIEVEIGDDIVKFYDSPYTTEFMDIIEFSLAHKISSEDYFNVYFNGELAGNIAPFAFERFSIDDKFYDCHDDLSEHARFLKVGHYDVNITYVHDGTEEDFATGEFNIMEGLNLTTDKDTYVAGDDIFISFNASEPTYGKLTPYHVTGWGIMGPDCNDIISISNEELMDVWEDGVFTINIGEYSDFEAGDNYILVQYEVMDAEDDEEGVSYWGLIKINIEDDEDEEGGYLSIYVDTQKDYSTDENSADADNPFITVYAQNGTEYHVAVFSSNRMFFDKNLTDFENATLVEDDEELEGCWKYTIFLKDVDFFNGLDEVDKVRIGVYKIEEDYRWIDAEKDYIVLFNDDSTFSLLEVLNIRMFYGNLTSGETSDGMISFATEDFINIEIPSSVDVHEMNVAVDYGGETRTYSLTDFKVNEPDPEDEEFDGYTYYMELTDDIKDLIRQHENETITYNFTYEYKGKTVSTSFKRILRGEILHQVVSISDLYNLFDFNIADEVLVDGEDEAVRLFCFDSNWHMAHNDWGGGYFKVYMNDTLVESFGLGDLVHPAPAYISLSVSDLGIDASGTYNIKITHLPDPEIDIYEDDETGEIIVRPCYILAEENVLISKDIVVDFGGLENSTIEIDDIEFNYGESGSANVTLDGASDIIANVIDHDEATVAFANGKVTVSGLDAGEYTLNITTVPEEGYIAVNKLINITVNKVDSSVSVGDLAFDYGANASTTVDLAGASGVTAKIVNSTAKPAVDGSKVSVSGLGAGTYTLEVTTVPDGNHNAVTGTATITVNKVDSEVSIDDLAFDYGGSASAVANVTGATGVAAKIVNSTVKPAVDGNKVTVSGLAAGTYTLEVTTIPDANHSAVTATANVIVSEIDTVIVVNTAFSRYATDFYSDGSKDGANGERGGFFYATLYDVNGNPLANKTVQIAINGPIYNVTTDSDGKAGLRVNLGKANTYTYALYFAGDEGYSASLIASSKLTVVEKPTSIIANSKYAFKPATKTKTVTVALNTIKNPYDNKLYLKAGKKLTLTVNGVTYSAKTDSKGVAKFNIKLTKAGTYKATVKFAGDSTYGSSSKSIKISISKSAKSNAALKGVGVGTAPKKLADPGALNIEGNYADYVANSNISTGNVDPAKKAAVIVVDKEFTRNATDFSGGERGGFFYATLTDSNGNPLANKTVQIAVNGPIYNVTTDKDGKAGLRVNLAKANTYTYALSFAGDDDYCPAMIASSKLTVIKKPISIDVKGLSFKASAKTKTVTVTLKTIKNEFDGKTYIKDGKKVTVKVNGITYSGSIKNGVVKFNVKLTKKGTYVAAVSFAGDSTYEPASQKVKIKIT